MRPRLRLPRITIAILTAAVLWTGIAADAVAKPLRRFSEQEIEGAALRYYSDVPVAVFSGSPEAMGRQHAALLADSAEKVIAYPRRFIAQFGLEALYPLMPAAGRVLMANAPPHHRREVDAIAANCSLNAGDLAVANTLLELRRLGCSAIVVEAAKSATGGPLLGRNFDFDSIDLLDKYNLVMVHRPADRRAFASVAYPGMSGVISGMNDVGLAIATLDVEESADGSPKFDPAGTPLALVFRRILEECRTVDEAERLLRESPRTTWMNLIVCDADRGAVFEITPKSVGRRDAECGLLCCTNHFRTAELAVDMKCRRYSALAGAQSDSILDVAAVQRRLHDATQDERTLQTMVFDPRNMVLHLAIGKPPTSNKRLTTIALGPLFEAPIQRTAERR